MSDTSSLINFTRDEFATSLRILLVGFSEWTEQIFGTDVISRSVPSAMASAKVDLSRPFSAGPVIENASFSWRMLQAYDFATTGEWDTTSLEEFEHEADAFEQIWRLPLESHGGMVLAPSIDPKRLPTPQEMCRLVFEHTRARLALLQDQPLTLGQVAMLAGLADKTIRMAANPKAPNRLVIYKERHNTYVEPGEALRWLGARPGFRPTVMREERRAAQEFSSPVELAAYCKEQRAIAQITMPQLMKKLAWGRALKAAYGQLEEASPDLDPRPLTVTQLLELGRALGVPDAAQFARTTAILLAPIAIDRECAALKAS